MTKDTLDQQINETLKIIKEQTNSTNSDISLIKEILELENDLKSDKQVLH